MTTFATGPQAEVRVRIGAGDLTFDASDRDDVDVDVQPRDPSNEADREHAAATRVELADGIVHVVAPQVGWRLGRTPALAVRIALPTGSHAEATTASAAVTTRGRLGSTAISTASGGVRIDAAAELHARTASGAIEVADIEGDASLTTASGSIAVGRIGGEAVLSTASGSARIEQAGESLSAKSASGSLRVGAAKRGRVRLDAASGSLHVGVPTGTAAFLDVRSVSGSVRTDLADTDGPADGDETLEVRARTVSGSVEVVRA